jgi:hypothetical protein
MPIFISYSHENKDFVDKLAIQLVNQNISVWVDKWELSIGDSLIDKVQEAVDGASALLVILSKASVASKWCKKELSSGLLRELEENRVVVMPVVLEDCDIPLFTRGKLFADFRNNFDDGLRTIVEGIAKVTNPSLARIKEPDYYTDWSIDVGDINGQLAVILNYAQLPNGQPYTVLTNIEILASAIASTTYHRISAQNGDDFAKLNVMTIIYEYFKSIPEEKPLLADQREKVKRFVIFGDSPGARYELRIGVRRLGEDTGRDVLVHTTNLITETYTHMKQVLKSPSET